MYFFYIFRGLRFWFHIAFLIFFFPCFPFFIDCKNGQDEKLCDDDEENKCDDFEFGCGNGECIPMSQTCDGNPGTYLVWYFKKLN